MATPNTPKSTTGNRSPLSDLLNLPAIAHGSKQSKPPNTGHARVLTSRECLQLLKEKEEKKKQVQLEKERRKIERELKKKEKEEEQQLKAAEKAKRAAEREAAKAKRQAAKAKKKLLERRIRRPNRNLFLGQSVAVQVILDHHVFQRKFGVIQRQGKMLITATCASACIRRI